MASTGDSGNGNGSSGAPQKSMQENDYPDKVAQNEKQSSTPPPPHYAPSPKHDPGHNWGSENPIQTQSEGQQLLDTGYRHGRQVYNITSKGKIVKFQPDGTPDNGFHAYEVSKPRDIPAPILKSMYQDGIISRAMYNKLRKGK